MNQSSGVNERKSEFVYDGQSRKVISREFTWSGTAWVQQSETRRVYDGMDVVQERDGSNAVTANYTRSGNIGGLLARSTSAGHFYYHYDGGGNVMQLTDAAQATVAQYTYDAYGNLLSSSGLQSGQPYRYSTKEYHSDSGLYDYGYRFYSPAMGRWINRDPIKEEGGLNLYAMVENDPMNSWDEYGLAGRGNKKGERDRTGSRHGTPKPNKGLKEIRPPERDRVLAPTPDGKGKKVPRPADMPFPEPKPKPPTPVPPVPIPAPNTGVGDTIKKGAAAAIDIIVGIGKAVGGRLASPIPFFYIPRKGAYYGKPADRMY